jgi:hypothetical protein
MSIDSQYIYIIYIKAWSILARRNVHIYIKTELIWIVLVRRKESLTLSFSAYMCVWQCQNEITRHDDRHCISNWYMRDWRKSDIFQSFASSQSHYYRLAYKDESTTMTASVIDLKPFQTMPSHRPEILHHHQLHRKLGSSTLNKTDEHCRSLFNLLPTSFRPRHHRQPSNKKGVDAVSIKRSIASYCHYGQYSDTSFIYH